MAGRIESNQHSWKLNSLDSLSLFRRMRLSGDVLSEERRSRLESAFNGVLNDPSVQPFLNARKSGKVKFDFDIREGRGLVMRFGSKGKWRTAASFAQLFDRKTPFGALQRELQKAEAYAKRKGLGARVFRPTQRMIGLQPAILRTSVIRTLEGPVPYPPFQEGNACAIDVGSLTRNTISGAAELPFVPADAAAKMASGVAGMTVAGGAMAVVQGGLIVRKSLKTAKLAYEHGDAEGMGQAALMGTSGLSYSTVGAGMVVNGSATLAGKTALAAAAGTAITVAGIAMDGLLAIYAAYGWKVTRQFRVELKEILNEKREPDEAERLREALAWVHEQVSLSDWEIMEIRQTAEEPEKEILKRQQKKWDQFERRVGVEASAAIRHHLPSFEALQEGLAVGDAASIEKARDIVLEVEKGNYKERVKYKLFFLIAVIGLIGFALALAFPPLAPVAFAIGALVWLTVDSTKIHGYVTEKCWQRHLKNRVPA